MRFIQPPVTPPPADINLEGKTAIVTGATEGIGQETARQLLVLRLSTLVFAVRNPSKGENGSYLERHLPPRRLMAI